METKGGCCHGDARSVDRDDGALAGQAHGPRGCGVRVLDNRAGFAAGDELAAGRIAAVKERFSYDL